MTNTYTLLGVILPYVNYLDELDKEEIEYILSLFDDKERKRIFCYIKTNSDKNYEVTKKRLFLFLCNLVDFKEIELRNKNKIKNIIPKK